MPSTLDILQQHLGPNEIAQIAQQLGVDPAMAQQAVNAALPAMVGGAASTAQTSSGAGTLQDILGSHGGILGNLGSIISAGGAGGGLLGSILGRHENTVQDGVAQSSGLGSDKVRQLLMILAPIVMGALAKRAMDHGTAQTDPGQLGQVLQQDAAQAQQQATATSPHMGGILGKILDMAESPAMRNR